jgi:hypothetical protein
MPCWHIKVVWAGRQAGRQAKTGLGCTSAQLHRRIEDDRLLASLRNCRIRVRMPTAASPMQSVVHVIAGVVLPDALPHLRGTKLYATGDQASGSEVVGRCTTCVHVMLGLATAGLIHTILRHC